MFVPDPMHEPSDFSEPGVLITFTLDTKRPAHRTPGVCRGVVRLMVQQVAEISRSIALDILLTKLARLLPL